MIKFLKFSCAILTVLSAIFFISCLFCRFSYIPFNADNVKNSIAYYSSDDFKGRLCGSSENDKAKDIIANYMKNHNLPPLFDEYQNDFNITVPIIDSNSKSAFTITDSSNNIIKEYICGIDYKEDGLNFRTNSLSFNKENLLNVLPSSIVVCKNNKYYIFYIPEDNTFLFRSSFVNSSKFEFAVQISRGTYFSLIDSINKGLNANINIPFTTTEKTVSNVSCIIKGTSNNYPPLILCAHFDHLGCDSKGCIYPGALDNASGTCFLLNLLQTLSSMPSPNRDIIFVALNGEELNLAGSKYFADTYKHMINSDKKTEVINFDMVGAKDYDISFVKCTDSENSDSILLKKLENICLAKNISYNVKYEDSSDHASFSCDKFDSLTICQSDTTNIHTPSDTYDKISTEDLNKVYFIVYSEILSSCYNTNKLFLYKNSTLTIVTVTTCIFSSITSISLVKKSS